MRLAIKPEPRGGTEAARRSFSLKWKEGALRHPAATRTRAVNFYPVDFRRVWASFREGGFTSLTSMPLSAGDRIGQVARSFTPDCTWLA
jgi:hypothetical protein